MRGSGHKGGNHCIVPEGRRYCILLMWCFNRPSPPPARQRLPAACWVSLARLQTLWNGMQCSTGGQIAESRTRGLRRGRATFPL